ESTQICGVILPEFLTSPAMKESKGYKTYLGYATDEEPVQKGKRVKRPAKKSTTKPAAGVIIREAPVETKAKSKEKEKVDVTRGKGIKLLSETHPYGSGIVAKKPPSVEKITPTVTSEGTGDKPGVPNVTEDDSTESESESWGNDEDDSNNDQESSNEGSEQENKSEEQESDLEQEAESKDDDQEEEEFVHTPPTDDKDDDDLKSESDDVIKSNEEKGIDDTTYQFDDEPTQTDKEKTEVSVTSSSRSSDLASKFLKFSYAMGYLTLERTTHSCQGDFPRLWINDIEDMVILVVQNRLTNISGDDVADFAIALRMFTRSLVIQKRVEDL
ncbi:hypothetical protein Tco_1422484, partial [Tanacetum coccineum]